tara:strand:+ start:72 stop:272 length:201 start_codon:yes stop_codon:yes gene_type:complete
MNERIAARLAETETECEDCRIEITTDGIEIDASQGDLAAEALVLTVIVFVVAMLYVAKKAVDSKFK